METGFPSPAQGYEEAPIDIIRYLMPHPECTFFMRVQGVSLAGLGLGKGDIIVIDRSVKPYDGAFAVGETEEGFICGRYSTTPKPSLHRPDGVICFTEKTGVFGVVTRIIKKP